MLDFSIIILSYNTRDLTMQCLHSVAAACQGVDAEVIVVDNASTDGSAQAIQADFPNVILLQNSENTGYARANNQAMRVACGKIIVLLNSDTVLEADALCQIQKAFASADRPGVVGPMLKNGDGTIQPSFGKFASLTTEFLFQSFLFKFLPTSFPLGDAIHPALMRSYRSPHLVDWVTGACFAIDNNVFDRTGGLCEELFMYGEDMEWCRRIRQSGFDVLYWPDAHVIHYARQSSRKHYDRWITNYTYGQLYFAVHYLGFPKARIFSLFVCIGSLWRILFWQGFASIRLKRQIEIQQRIKGYREAFKMAMIVLITERLGKLP